MLSLINQVFEMEGKLSGRTEIDLGRHFDRIRNHLAELGYSFHSPLGEPYKDSRTDCEATIVGELKDPMIISKVIKPIVYQKSESNLKTIVQKAIVLAEHKK